MLLRKTETCRSGFDCRGVSRRSETSLGNACCQHRRAEPLSPSPFQSVPVEKRKSSLEVFLKFTAKVNYVLFTGRYQNSFNQNILLDLWLFWFWACFLHIDLEPFFLPLLSSTKFCETFAPDVLNRFSSGLVTVRSAPLWALEFASFSNSVERSTEIVF